MERCNRDASSRPLKSEQEFVPRETVTECGLLRIAASVLDFENMREINTLRDVQMAQRKADNSITKKFIQSIAED